MPDEVPSLAPSWDLFRLRNRLNQLVWARFIGCSRGTYSIRVTSDAESDEVLELRWFCFFERMLRIEVGMALVILFVYLMVSRIVIVAVAGSG